MAPLEMTPDALTALASRAQAHSDDTEAQESLRVALRKNYGLNCRESLIFMREWSAQTCHASDIHIALRFFKKGREQ